MFPSILQGGLAAIQLITALGMNPRRPTYNIPQEVKDKLGQNQAYLNARSAGAARGQENIMNNQASTLLNAQQAGGGVSNQLLAGAMAQANSNQALGNLAASETEDYSRRLGNLGAAQSEMAGYQDKAFDYHQNQPYQDAAATKSALTNAGIENLFGASQGFAGLFGQGQGQQQMQPMGAMNTLPQRGFQPVQSMQRPQQLAPIAPQGSPFWMDNLRWNYPR